MSAIVRNTRASSTAPSRSVFSTGFGNVPCTMRRLDREFHAEPGPLLDWRSAQRHFMSYVIRCETMRFLSRDFFKIREISG
ncbi:hypothetical protein [Burkholderia metallica]|uniref:hypothetical protein n=1 Tax=Burkholderia metallica TaxID=488729 RepID=UPI00157B5A5F|nr:hypothetical protein [Burkholderia metallica]